MTETAAINTAAVEEGKRRRARMRLREQMKLRKADSVAVLQNWVEDAGEVR